MEKLKVILKKVWTAIISPYTRHKEHQAWEQMDDRGPNDFGHEHTCGDYIYCEACEACYEDQMLMAEDEINRQKATNQSTTPTIH